MNKVEEKARGILKPEIGKQNFHLARYEPSDELAFFVEHYWCVQWDLRDQAPYNSETLPYPSIHITVEPNLANIMGIVTQKFSRLLEGQGWVFGIKIRPGAFYPIAQRPVSSYTNRIVPIEEIFGATGMVYASSIRRARNNEEKVYFAESFLNNWITSHALPYDENVTTINRIVDTISNERAIIKVDQLVKRFKIGKRTMQRLFNQYVGVSPKWIIQRYRLHEATEQVTAGEEIDWAKLAAELGYFDQAHFIKDFKAIIGLTPVEYAKQAKAFLK